MELDLRLQSMSYGNGGGCNRLVEQWLRNIRSAKSQVEGLEALARSAAQRHPTWSVTVLLKSQITTINTHRRNFQPIWAAINRNCG